MLDEKAIRVFKYLDILREAGTINMFASSCYLMGKFNLDKNEAEDILKRWMDTFQENVTPEERIAQEKKNISSSLRLMNDAYSLDDNPDFVYEPFTWEDTH